jgi:deazaflavin-dependent oxidoreductase (nitroreductase family)
VCKDLLFRVGTGIHRLLLRGTGGRLGGRLAGMPVVLLTTTGRRTGRRRTTVLTTPVHDDDRVVLVASYGGDDRHPAWFLNLREHPDVEVEMDGRSRPMRARMATDDEKGDLWPQVVAAYGGYSGYQARTDREIPVVVLERRG